MKTKFIFSSLFLAALAAATASFAGAANNKSEFGIADFEQNDRVKNRMSAFIEDEIVVKIKGERSFKVLKVAKGQVTEAVKEWRKKSEVESAEPNYVAHALSFPNDPYFGYQWHLKSSNQGGMNAENAWEISSGTETTVAIVDTGIAYEAYGNFCQAPDLANTCFKQGYNFVNNAIHANDDNGHGTHVAGTVAQSTNNGMGVAGVAYNACLMPVKTLDKYGSGTYANIANGIIWAADNGADVINLSLGGIYDSSTLSSAVEYAYSKGVVIAAACGNDGSGNGCLYPAAYNNYVISVGATQYDKTKAPYSNYGQNLDLVAPGGNTQVDQNGDGYVDGVLQQTFAKSNKVCSFGYYFYQGTSMASPHVAGAAALLISRNNAMNPDQIENVLKETALDLGATGRDNTFGYGLIDAAAALQWNTGPACSSPADCDDNNPCTNDICTDPGTSQAACLHTNLTDNTVCGSGICCAGTCSMPACSTDSCNDNNACTNDSCAYPGTCSAACVYTPITECNNDDGCCPAACSYLNDNDCNQAVLCWSKANQYLYPNATQYKKFCKCAQGIYSYKASVRISGSATVGKYVNTADNEIWTVNPSLAYRPVIQVVCSDKKSYPTNIDYYFPK